MAELPSHSSDQRCGRSSAIANRLRTLVGKKTWKLQKRHTQKKDFKTAKPEISFFFLIFLFNST